MTASTSNRSRRCKNGCDASVLLDSAGELKSEKEEIPNLSLRGFKEIDLIKSKVEEALRKCNLYRMKCYLQATVDVQPCTGKVHCNFILKRLSNFNQTNQPDPSIDPQFLEVLRSECSHPSSPPSQSPSTSEKRSPAPAASLENRAMPMDYEGAGNGFGKVYYRSLLQGKGLLVVDQQLMAREDTKSWVETYAKDMPQFRRDFGLAMFKLTHIQSPDGGEVRLSCRKSN